ncbi:MAG: AbrB/MazE/SpoVT family DNA-binding domain-containing protein [Acidobacteriaceae bacterium]|nr:AbrB/MazE/SpoVT family DNA-binding domain-containing protein [Acidobacteriaceae bacterium]
MQSPEEIRTRLNENGSLVLPVSVQRALGLQPGDEVLLRIENDELRMTAAAKRVERARQLFKKYVGEGMRLSDELLTDRRREAANG